MDLRASSVIKLGGSLLDLPDLPERLADFLADFSRPRPIVICGGGDAVELVRRWDRLYGLGEEESHWIALRVLSTTAHVLAAILPDRLVLVDSPEDCPPAWERGLVPVYDVYHFIIDIDEASPDPLPRRWRVTSDSIAARMAEHFGAPELVLLKSSSRPERLAMTEAAEDGFVDAQFPFVARHIPRVVSFNFRRTDDPGTELVAPGPEMPGSLGPEDDSVPDFPLAPPDDVDTGDEL